jgi:hypothetical protein
MEWQIQFGEAIMSIISESVSVKVPRNDVFLMIKTEDFMRKVDSNFGNDTKVILKTDRVIRSISSIEKIGNVEIERVYLPEVYSIITQRRNPLDPFKYQISMMFIEERVNETKINWINDFELEDGMENKLEYIKSIIRQNDIKHLEKTKQYIEGTL